MNRFDPYSTRPDPRADAIGTGSGFSLAPHRYDTREDGFHVSMAMTAQLRADDLVFSWRGRDELDRDGLATIRNADVGVQPWNGKAVHDVIGMNRQPYHLTRRDDQYGRLKLKLARHDIDVVDWC